jgi:hypothetical protein
MSLAALKTIPAGLSLSFQPQPLLENAARVLLMFNVRGDENIRHNFSGEPLLNVFVGLMFIFGVLVAISRLHQRRYWVLLALFAACLLPAIVSSSGVPNAAHAAAALPIVAMLAAIGISYMLDLWHSTFPINSAARSVGQSVIVVLLGLTIFQGYTQYFRAWAASNETYLAYNEAAVAATRHLLTQTFTGTQAIIAGSEELPVVHYLTSRHKDHQELSPAQLAALPVGTGPRRFIITAEAREEAATNLALKYPGGKLQAKLSPFSHNEIYYVYEVAK